MLISQRIFNLNSFNIYQNSFNRINIIILIKKNLVKLLELENLYKTVNITCPSNIKSNKRY